MAHGVLQRNHVTIRGAGSQTVVFGHGFGGDQTVWDAVRMRLGDAYRTVCFDYVGCGRSDRMAYDPVRYGTLEGYACDLEEVLDALELHSVDYVGHSFSGVVGALVALRNPSRFRQLVLVGTSPYFLDDPPHYHGGLTRRDVDEMFELMDRNLLGWADFMAPIAMGNADRPELAREFAARLSHGDPEITRRFAHLAFGMDARGIISRVEVPTLIVQCTEDSIVPRGVGEYMHAHMARSQLVYIDASGHCPHVSHPDEVVRLLRGYLGTREPE